MNIDLDIAESAAIRPISEIASEIGMDAKDAIPYGHDKAKIPASTVISDRDHAVKRGAAALILVTAMSPTPAGEGKTTTSIGLADGIAQLAAREAWDIPSGKVPAALALREPSLGPVFGMKGGAAGGGYAQVLPMEDINLHFTGDFAAVALANNLASAMVDNHIHHGNELGIDPRRVEIRRVVDLNDRALRQLAIGLGGYTGGMPREDAFDIVVASEVMAVFCLATSLADLKRRLGGIVVGRTFDKKPVTVSDLGIAGSMTALLRTALSPNLVQTIEHTPAFVHGGPFANIAHGCNSVLATTAALNYSMYAVTEAGFGSDLGAEKFLDIKCRAAGIWPSVAVVVATVRALKYHGEVPQEELEEEDVQAALAGMPNLRRHIEILTEIYDLPVVVALNRFPSDTDAEVTAVLDSLREQGIAAEETTHWANGGEGALTLARSVVKATDGRTASVTPRYAYELNTCLQEKIETIARRVYGASGIEVPPAVARKLQMFAADGFGDLPVCIAKTQYSFSTDPLKRGAPTGHTVSIRDVRLAAGAGYVVAICGDIMTMPGLPKKPAALSIDVDDDGRITGLF